MDSFVMSPVVWVPSFNSKLDGYRDSRTTSRVAALSLHALYFSLLHRGNFHELNELIYKDQQRSQTVFPFANLSMIF